MTDESWRDSYDEWKLRSPDDDEPECDHDDYDVDILDGRCRCLCGHSWYASSKEIEAEIERQREYSEWEECENRRQWWRDKTLPIRMFFFRMLERIWPRRALNVLHDDEIPF